MSLPSLRAFAAILVGCVATLVYWTSGFLPELVVSNFEAGGRPTSFASRETYRTLVTVVALIAPALFYSGTVWLPQALLPLFEVA